MLIADTGPLVAMLNVKDRTHVATIDHRPFRAVRPAHCDAFELLPAL
jgi:hypothetical protein